MEPDRSRGNARALVLATLAFLFCFYAWSLLGPDRPYDPPRSRARPLA
jgi:nitrate/nitrite transporter NarK